MLLSKNIKWLLLAVSVTIISCATMKPPPLYNPTSEENNFIKKKSQNIEVAIEPFDEPSKIVKYFGTDLLSNGIYPIYIVIKNGNDKSILIDNSTFSLSLATEPGKNTAGRGGELVDGTVALGATTVGAILLSPILMLAGAKSFSDSTAINYTFNRNKLHPATVSPSQSIEGFIYFPIKDKTAPEQWYLLASIKTMANNESIELSFASN